MKPRSSARLLRIYLSEQDKLHGRVLYEQLLEKAHQSGLTGCTVLRGMAGFGAASHQIHRASILRLSEKMPIVIEIVDLAEKLEPLLPVFEAMIEESGKGTLMTMEKVEIVRCKA
jgi:PII-like signaling protein